MVYALASQQDTLGEVQVPGFPPGRITEAVVGRDVGDLQSLLPLGAGLSPSLEQVGHGFVWPSLENLQGWRCPHQSTPGLQHPPSEGPPLPPKSQLCPLLLVLPSASTKKNLAPSSIISICPSKSCRLLLGPILASSSFD